MGLLTILKKLKEKEHEMRILILGLDNAGKTTVVRRMMGKDVNEVQPTLGFNIDTLIISTDSLDQTSSSTSTSIATASMVSSSAASVSASASTDYSFSSIEKAYNKGSTYSINVWDVGGQSTIRAYWKNYFEETDGLIWVVDSCDVDRLKLCRDELHRLVQKQDKLAGASVLILANKQDIQGALSVEQIIDVLDLKRPSFCDNRHWNVIACSAKDPQPSALVSIQNGFKWLVTDIAERIFFEGGL